MPNTTTRRDRGLIANRRSPHCKLRSVDLSAVRWTRGFWAQRFRQCHDITLPHLHKLMCDPDWGHALRNLEIAAGLAEGDFAGTHWQDEWVYKWLEAASSVYGATGDEALSRQMDELIDVIAQAQQPDGYLATQITVPGWERLQEPRHHELYTMGHLISAACAHHRATGKTSFLDIARQVGDYLFDIYRDRPPELAHFPINPSAIMAGVELYRTTGDSKYLDFANAIIDQRGSRPGEGVWPGGSDINQDRVPLRDEHHVVGHNVWYTYLYAGAADAYMETGDESLLAALDRLWHDLAETKLYVTGGTCPLHRGLSIRGDDVHEAAAEDYHLPSSTAYNETCGQIGSVMWNWRMLAINARARHADMMEQQLYNSIISGLGLDGASWFYTNPLRWYGKDHPLLSQDAYERFQPGTPPRRNHICCPSNLVRTIAGLHGYLYSASDDALWLHHYGGNAFDGELPDGRSLKLTQETNYPWDGEIAVKINRAPDGPLALMLRIPGWADGARLRINGKPTRVPTDPGTYARLDREWSKGDEITLSLPMDVRLIEAHPRVEHLRNHVAVMRGPLVYCLESPDLPRRVKVSEVRLPRAVKLAAEHRPRLLGGVTTLSGEARRVPEGDWSGRLYRRLPRARAEKLPVTLIPYYAWANRGVSEMAVWIPLA